MTRIARTMLALAALITASFAVSQPANAWQGHQPYGYHHGYYGRPHVSIHVNKHRPHYYHQRHYYPRHYYQQPRHYRHKQAYYPRHYYNHHQPRGYWRHGRWCAY